MRKTVVTFLFVVFSQSGLAAETQMVSEAAAPPSATKSILYGAAIGALVGAAASMVNAKGALYQFSFFIAAGSAAGLGQYYFSSASSRDASLPRREPEGIAVSANVFRWNF